MAAQKGRDLLIKIKNENGFYKTVVGLRSKDIKLNSQAVDVTQSESVDGWREILPGAGVKTATFSGSGIFQDSATDAIVRTVFFNQETPDFQIIIPDFGVLAGKFLVTSLSYSGTYSEEAAFDMALSSAGALTFAAL